MKFSRFIAAALSLSLVCGAFPVYNNTDIPFFSACAASVTEGPLTFEVYSDHAAVTGYNETETDIVIPDSVEGVPVTAIGRNAFMNCESITSVVIPDSVTSIGAYAFWECRNMKLDKLPASLAEIGKNAFYRCDQITEVTIPEGVSVIPEGAFYWCENLKTVSMGDSVTAIGDKAFIYCSSLETVSLSPNIRTIGSYAFYSCMKLKELVLTDAIESVGTSAFAECSANIVADRIPVVGYQGNAQATSYSRIGSPVKSYIHEKDGAFEIARADDNKAVLINMADENGVGEMTASIRYELPVFGGVFFGEKYNFIVFGDTNYEEDDQREVFRIVKYSHDWERLGSTSVYGANTHIAVDGGSLRMAEKDGNLYVYTCHTMYASSRDGLHHQANLQIIVNQEAMVGAANDNNYASHSFDQFVRADESGVYYADLGDAYPRSVVLHNSDRKSLDAIKIQGSIGDNSTGVTLGGLELSEKNILLVGNTVDQSDADSYDAGGQRNIFVSVSGKSLGGTSYRFLTDYSGSEGIRPLTPELIKADDNKFFVLWQELDTESGSTACYIAQLNGNGDTVAGPAALQGNWLLSDCQPVYGNDGMITWFTVAENGGEPVVYRLDPEQALDPEYVPPVTTTTTASAPSKVTTTTTAAAPGGTTATGTALRERNVEFTFSGLSMVKGEGAAVKVDKADGEVRKLTLSYTKDDGSTVSMDFYPDENGAFSAGDSRTYRFTAECALDEVIVNAVFTGELPEFSFSFTPPQTTTKSGRTPGDANLDGAVTLNDAVAVLQYVALESKYPLDPKGYVNADVDGVEGVSAGDALFIQMYDAKLVELPAE